MLCLIEEKYFVIWINLIDYLHTAEYKNNDTHLAPNSGKKKSKFREVSLGQQTMACSYSSGNFVAYVLKIIMCFEITTKLDTSVWGHLCYYIIFKIQKNKPSSKLPPEPMDASMLLQAKRGTSASPRTWP